MNTTSKLEMIPEFVDIHEYHPSVIHCLMTGAPIGELYQAELLATLNVCASIDDLRIRTIAAMRPSSRWNKLNPQSLILMRDSHPREVLAYLINRLFAATPNMKADIWDERESRIYVYQCCHLLDLDLLKSMTHTLIELDAKIGLTSIFPDSRSMLSLRMFINHDFGGFNGALIKYAKRLIADALEREDIALRMTTPWAKQLYVKSWMEQKPPSQTAQAAAEKKSRDDDMAKMIYDLKIGHDPKPEPQPLVTPALKAGFAALKRAAQ